MGSTHEWVKVKKKDSENSENENSEINDIKEFIF
jgi:hypothetical protein